MAKRVYIAELDAHTARLESKIDGIQNRTVSAGKKMETAFMKVGGAMIAAFSARAVFNLGKDMIDLGIKIGNVRRAFERLDDPTLLRRLRDATKNTIDDLTLMSSANFAAKMRIPGDLLAKGMEFASLTALETGANVEYMMNSFVIGTARQSVKIIDNLGISAKDLAEEIKRTGDFMIALENIMDRELNKMRGNIDETVLATQQLNTNLENQKATIGESLVPVWNLFIAGVSEAITLMQDFSGYTLGKQLAEQEATLNRIVKDRTKQMFDILGINENLVKGVFEIKTAEEEVTDEVKKRVETYDQLLTRLQKYSEYLDLKPIDKEALLKGIGAPTGGYGADEFDVTAISDKQVDLLKWKAEQGRDEIVAPLKEAQSPMTALVSLSNQMAGNFQFAGHTFVGQLSQAIAMVDSISNIILTVASIFGGGGGGFGIGGLLGLIGLEKGGRVSNKFGNISLSNIPSFASGGSYSTPSFSGPFAGGYPVMVHRNETLDVYNSGQSSRMENKMDAIKNAIMAGTLASTRKGGGGGSVNVYLDGKKLFEVNQARGNRAGRAGKNVSEMV